MPKIHVVELSRAEREMLRSILAKGRVLARKRKHAQILLKADQARGGPAWSDARIAEAFDVGVRTVERIRERCVTHGLEDALLRRRDPHARKMRRKLDGVGEAQLCKLACSAPPAGRERWSLRLPADHLVRLEVTPSISHETVRATLKKTNSNRG